MRLLISFDELSVSLDLHNGMMAINKQELYPRFNKHEHVQHGLHLSCFDGENHRARNRVEMILCSTKKKEKA